MKGRGLLRHPRPARVLQSLVPSFRARPPLAGDGALRTFGIEFLLQLGPELSFVRQMPVVHLLQILPVAAFLLALGVFLLGDDVCKCNVSLSLAGPIPVDLILQNRLNFQFFLKAPRRGLGQVGVRGIWSC